MSAEPVAVLIMARAPRPGEVLTELEPLLGRDGCVALYSELLAQTAAWAREVAPDAVHVVFEPADGEPDLHRLVGDDAVLFPALGEGIAGATVRVFRSYERPVLVVWPCLPRLRADHATAAREDLAHDSDLVIGPAIDDGLYLLGLARPLPAQFSLPDAPWGGPGLIAVAHKAGLEVGILRAERPLYRPADVRAAVADPLLPEPIRRILEGHR